MSVVAQRKRTARYEQRREEILREAVLMINARGVRGMVLGDVAARLNLAPTATAYYFRRKEDLAAACFRQEIARFTDLIAEAEKEPGQPLKALIANHFELQRSVRAGEAAPIVVFNDIRALADPLVDQAYSDMFRRLRVMLGPKTPGHTQERQAANARTYFVLSQIFWSFAWLSRYDMSDYSRAADRFHDILTNGLSPKTGAWPSPVLRPADTGAKPPAADNNLPDLFLRTATDLVNEEGYHGASIDRIVARLNVTKGAFYHYSETKDDLIAACFERSLTIMSAALTEALHTPGDERLKLAQLCMDLIAPQVSGATPLLRTTALTSVPEAIQQKLFQAFEGLAGRFAALISDGIASGAIRPVDPMIAAQMAISTINSAAELKHFSAVVTPEDVWTIFVRPFLDGLAS